MDNNDILIRIRYALDYSNAEMIKVFKLGGLDISHEDIRLLLIKSRDKEIFADEEDDQEENMPCHNLTLDAFLNGLIIYKRGKQEQKPGAKAPELNIAKNHNVNNIVFKKLKIALQLTSEDILEILSSVGVEISKGELSAVFRKEGHKNYKECGDRYLRNFLKGLAIKYRGLEN